MSRVKACSKRHNKSWAQQLLDGPNTPQHCAYTLYLLARRDLVMLTVGKCTANPALACSQDALGQHGVGHLDEAGNVGPRHVVALLAVKGRGVEGFLVEVRHDGVEPPVDLLARPGEAERVLRHLEAGDRDAARVGRLARSEEHLLRLQVRHRLGGARHVRALADGGLAVHLVLGGAREGDVGLDRPDPLAPGGVLGLGVLLDVLGDAAALHGLEVDDVGELLAVDAVHVGDVAAGVGHGDALATEVDHLLAGVGRDVAGAGEHDVLALEVRAFGLEHLTGEVDQAVAGSLGADETPAPLEALAGEDARELVGELLVHAEHGADLTPADADVAGGDVGELADVAEELDHERLAEADDLGVGLALGVEVGAALAAAHRQTGERVLEYLLEAQELKDRQVHRRVEAEAALERADGLVELGAEATVHVLDAVVVDPRDAELDHALRLNNGTRRRQVLGVRLQNRLERLDDLGDRLDELGLIRVACHHGSKDLCHAAFV